LALKVIGGSMVGKTTREEWEFQLHCLRESRKLPEQQEEEELFGRLKLSYDNLDNDNPVCKECFLSFAAFPEDRMVKMGELIKLWKAQGLLDDPTKKLGDDLTLSSYYLVGLLIGRSLIELARDLYDDSFSCKVHDVMRDLALHIIEGEKPITCLYRPGKDLVEFPADWIRRYEKQPCEVLKLSLMENDLTTLNGVTFSAPKLQVLLLGHNDKLKAMPKQFLKGIENLKVLDLSNCNTLKSLPREIGKLRQLTHLLLDMCRNLESLPKEIGKLTQLTYLNLFCCFEIKTLPIEIGKLTQLTHLHLGACEKLKCLPKKVGELTQLIHLDLFSCSNLKYCPSTMGDLRSLQYLNLNGPSTNALWGKPSWNLYGQAFAVDICKLPTLTELHISGNTCEIVELCNQLWKLISKLVKLKSFHMSRFDKVNTVPDGIQSMLHLEEFSICQCKHIKILPSFITLFSKLKMLKLYDMFSLESLPALNTLKMLSTLSIEGCKLIKKLPDSFRSSDAFPSLKKLNCFNSGLVEFLEVEDGAMSKLQELNLDLTNIKSLPKTLIYLKNLKVVYICKDRFDDLCKKFENSWLSGKFSLKGACHF
jgi:Leucine-rich repeat (LRR) protein